jgi:monofunctional biosynthetic peptidoglycan transglycosylase
MKQFFGRIFRWIRIGLIIFLVSSLFFTIFYRFVRVPLTPLMVIRYVENVFKGNPAQIQKNWKPIGQISDNMVLAVVAAEDNNFLTHSGFDLEAIKKARKHNETHKRKRGASTISQQTAKNVFLWPGRTWVRKGLEVYFTVLIEVFWSKERIMEVYLNVIETGNGVYGTDAAARNYFKKPASKLTRAEAALIAASLPNPLLRNPGKPSAYLNNRKSLIMKYMNNIGTVEFN